MRARGIRSYHRPGRLEEALALAAQGAVPLGGGTRLLAAPRELPNLLDLQALDLGGILSEDGDLVFGAGVTLQDVVDSEAAEATTVGLLPAACRAQCPSRMRRNLATLAGEAVFGATDSEVAAALLALNAVFVVAHPDEPRESPALRFVQKPDEDLRGGGLVLRIVIPGAPDGSALERASPLPTAPPIVAVAVTVAFSGEKCSRARIALAGLTTRPARILDAEAQVERTAADEEALRRAADQAARLAPLRGDAQASEDHKRHLVRVLTQRGLRRALQEARTGRTARLSNPRTRPTVRGASSLPYFTSGRLELSVNGRPLRAEAEARTSLVEVLRRLGLHGTKDACGTGDCGACTVLLDGRPVNACLTLAVRAHGRSVHTVEGSSSARSAPSLTAAFVETGAFHCGFCAPATALATRALLEGVPDSGEDDARDALSGCLCPCTGHGRALVSVRTAAAGRKVAP
jgi:aerobic-type carbon monoxide dehydrogenase small subunit (CoxS/CutS family)/CO/xanthine dehydrogenase FAD-binding subunit